ncbi:MAG: PDZ domain-containing protein [Flavobacterium sp.]|nr:PDZ domain-containing protein [Flavobacterium sp.]MBP6587437.1 PDZ domain-containing protein [Flavobacterium sp.]
MKKTVILCFLFIYGLPTLGQEGFIFQKNVDKVEIPFKLINNLIFIPIKVNGIELNFLLDSGVDETLLFSMDDKKEVSFFNVEKVTLRGLGSEASIEGLKSQNNTLEVPGLKSTGHLLYIILDQTFNLSSHMGIPVNGIIGYHFLKNNLVEINYEKKRITIYDEENKIRKKIEKKFQEIPITIEKLKPYIRGSVIMDTSEIPVKLLVDIGNSDAVWLFQNASELIKVPEKNFEDYLGKGFSGDIEGRRAQIRKFTMSKFEFQDPVVAFPDTISIRNVKMVQDRAGSVGAEVLRRFTVAFDYPNRKMYLKKNGHFNDPFSYNKSGIELQHYGLQWVQETVRLETVPLSEGTNLMNNFKYKFELKPVYLIANVRKNSTAALSGIQKDDILVSINGVPAYKYSLEKINSLLKSEEERWITLEVERKGEFIKFKFQLLNVL